MCFIVFTICFYIMCSIVFTICFYIMCSIVFTICFYIMCSIVFTIRFCIMCYCFYNLFLHHVFYCFYDLFLNDVFFCLYNLQLFRHIWNMHTTDLFTLGHLYVFLKTCIYIYWMFKEHNSSHTSPIGERPLDVPKEIWRLVDHIYNFGMNQVCDTQYLFDHIFVDSTVFSTASYFLQ